MTYPLILYRFQGSLKDREGSSDIVRQAWLFIRIFSRLAPLASRRFFHFRIAITMAIAFMGPIAPFGEFANVKRIGQWSVGGKRSIPNSEAVWSTCKVILLNPLARGFAYLGA